jgi:hypothetical protein
MFTFGYNSGNESPPSAYLRQVERVNGNRARGRTASRRIWSNQRRRRAMRSSVKLNSDHNEAIRAEVGDQLRILLSKEQPKLTSRVQHLLDCVSRLDASTSN